MRVNWWSIPWEYAGAARANELIMPPRAPTHATVTTQNAHLELIYRECIRGEIETNELTDLSQNTTTRTARTSERGQ